MASALCFASVHTTLVKVAKAWLPRAFFEQCET
jgi:hypothetical protein